MKSIVLACIVVAVTAGDASAQMTMGSFSGYLTGHLGAIGGGSLSAPRLTGGASVAVHEENGWGAELDFGLTRDASSGPQFLDIKTYMVNASWVQPEGLIRPFGGAGAGIVQIDGCNFPCTRAATTYDFGLSAGGGAFAALNDVIGFRGDLRYFWTSADHRDLQRADNFGFWRAAVGVTFMWAVAP
ncbi:MAG TPA: outer membrane beta-barrel protein [Vicinamibacterales bacterium]|nr:outer membrane beta-barrel protein [Vicinamibacterales bacterium]